MTSLIGAARPLALDAAAAAEAESYQYSISFAEEITHGDCVVRLADTPQ